MGGAGLYHPPVKEWSWISTWTAHTNRSTPSTEPGVDWGCPRFTPLYAAASGVVVEVYDGIGPATGRFITIDLDDGRRVRYLHLESRIVRTGQRVEWGQHIGYTGATGYGEADWSWNVAGTGGSHVHETIFPGHYYVFGRYATLDPWPLTDTENDMWNNYEEFARDLHRALQFDVRAGNFGASAENGPRIWDRLNDAVTVAAQARTAAEAAAAKPSVALTDADRKAIAAEVAAQIKMPTVAQIDYAALAKAVNDDAARRLAN